jgi:hypothetical protein
MSAESRQSDGTRQFQHVVVCEKKRIRVWRDSLQVLSRECAKFSPDENSVVRKKTIVDDR